MAVQDLEQLEQLLALAEAGKDTVQTLGDAQLTSLWDWLLEQIRALIDNLSSGLSTTISNVENGVKNWVSEKTNSINTALNDIYTGVKDWVKDRVSDVKTAVTNGFNNVSTWVNNAVSTVSNTVTSVETNIKNFISDKLSGVGDVIAGAINGIKSAIESIRDTIGGIAQQFAETIAGFIGVIIDDVTYVISQAARDVVKGISNLITPIIERIINVFEGIKTGITNAINAVKDWLTNVYDTVRNGINTAVQTVGDWVTGAYNAAKEWIGGAIERVKEAYETVKKSVEDLIQGLLDFLKTLFAGFVAWFNGTLVPWAQNALANILKVFMAASDWAQGITGLTDDDINAILGGDLSRLGKAFAGTGKSIGQLLASSPLYGALYAVAYLYNQISLAFVPSQVAASRYAEISLGLTPAPENLMQNAYLLGKISKDELLENMRLAGIPRDRAEKALEGLRNLPTAGHVQEAFLRGFITEDEHDTYLKAMGYKDEDIRIFKLLYFRLPPVSDIIRMAVREAFSPEIAEKFGQYEDYPEIFTKWAVQQGFSEDWAKAYWAAHWDLPSATMGFEMLHRGIITEDELKLLLRALDVMPYWREKLIKLSYNPLTRVDVRRMYQLGVLTEEEVYKAYRDLGYDDTNARRLTEFTKRYSAPEDESELSEFRRLARTTYSQAYRRGIISRDEYKTFLINLKYVEEDAELLISLDDYYLADKSKIFDLDNYRKDYYQLCVKAYKIGVLSYDDFTLILRDLGYTDSEIALEVNALEAERNFYLRSLILDKIGEMFVNFIIDDTHVYSYLNVFGFSQTEIERAIEEWQISRNLRTKRPPISDLRRFLNQGLITVEDFLNELRGQGYNEKYIELYRLSLGA